MAFSVSGLGLLARAVATAARARRFHPAGLANLLVAIAYLGHWFVVIPWVTLRMSLLPKRLVWAKTSHGQDQPVQV